MKKMYFIPAMFLTLTLMIAGGCTRSRSVEPYTAEFPYDPQQYMLFLNKEVQGITNNLTTCVMAVTKLANGDYPKDQTLMNIQNCLALLRETQEMVKSMRPPAIYTDTRNTFLSAIQNTEINCLACAEELQEENTDKAKLLELRERLQGNLMTLTSSVNAYWK